MSSLLHNVIYTSFQLSVPEPLMLCGVSHFLMYVGSQYICTRLNWLIFLINLSQVDVIIRPAKKTLKSRVSPPHTPENFSISVLCVQAKNHGYIHHSSLSPRDTSVCQKLLMMLFKKYPESNHHSPPFLLSLSAMLPSLTRMRVIRPNHFPYLQLCSLPLFYSLKQTKGLSKME